MTSVALLITFFPAIRTFKTGPVVEELELPPPRAVVAAPDAGPAS